MGSPVQSKGKGSIRKRLAFMICMIAALLVGIQTALGLFLGLNVMSYIVGEDHKRLAVVLSNATSQMIDDEVKKLEDISSAPAWKDAAVSGNLKYISMDDDSIAKYMAEMDKRWADSESSGPFIKLYTDSALSAEMTDIIKENNEIAEIMLTDMRGALIAASGETTDFYQGDEDWWQKAFAGGDGRKFIGEVSFDESANVLAIAFAFPVQGGGLGPGRAAGVMKVVVNTDKFFEPLTKFKVGKTGHAVLADRDNNIIFHPDMPSLGKKAYTEAEKHKILHSKRRWAILKAPHTHVGDVLSAFSDIDNTFLADNGVRWNVFIDQSTKEVFKPLYNVLLNTALVTGILTLLMAVPLGFVAGGMFVRPLKKLSDFAERIAEGDLDQEIRVRTGDEIEALAGSFSKMMEKIKEKQGQLGEWSHTLELRVDDRTRELADAQRATLNILEDFQGANAALKQAKDKAELLYKIVPSAVFTIDGERRITSWNDKAAEITGYSAEEVIGKDCSVFKDLPCGGRCGLYEDGDLRSSMKSTECVIRRKDGPERIISKNADIFKDVNGEVIGAIESFEDITERKKAVEEVARLASFSMMSPSPIIEITETGEVVFLNPSTRKRFLDLERDKTHPIIRDLVANLKMIKSWEKKDFVIETAVFSKTYEQHASYMPETKTIRSYIVDITERKNIEKMKDEFVATVSHELRTPLSITKEGISLILDKITGDINEKQAKILTTSKDNIDRLARIIDAILDISKIEAGKMALDKKPIDIRALAASVASSFEPLAKDKGLELIVNVPKTPLEINIDSDKITQVFTNLINNSIKFTEKGHIEIAIREIENMVECRVSDTGMGISQEDMPKVFAKFQQFSRATGAGAKGTGLGLSIAKGIVDMHKGTMRVESEPGKGSSFVFTLPKK